MSKWRAESDKERKDGQERCKMDKEGVTEQYENEFWEE